MSFSHMHTHTHTHTHKKGRSIIIDLYGEKFWSSLYLILLSVLMFSNYWTLIGNEEQYGFFDNL